MIDIEGRKLPLEKIFFRNKTIIANEEADWGRDAVKEHVISPVSAVYPLPSLPHPSPPHPSLLYSSSPSSSTLSPSTPHICKVPLQNWILVVTRRDQTKAMDFLNMMKRVGPPMGIEVRLAHMHTLHAPLTYSCVRVYTHTHTHTNSQVHDAKVLEVPNDRTETYLQAIRSEIGPKLQLVVTIFPTSRDDRYSAMKKLCCIDSPVPSQVSGEPGFLPDLDFGQLQLHLQGHFLNPANSSY